MKIKFKHNKGFTLIELLAAVAIVGVIATLALPRYRSMVARSRQAEATTNLGMISELQKAYYYDGERGYYHGGLHYGIDKCAKSATEAHNELGFRLADCSKSRYRYITNKGNDCAKSDGSTPQGQVYPGCSSNDVWHITLAGALSNPHDVVSKCPLGISSASATCNPGSLPSPPPAPLSSSSTARTPSPPPSPPTPTCSHSHCWVLADKTCVKCGIVGGIKTTVPCSTCKIPKPYVYKPPAPPSVYVAPPSSPPPSGSPPSGSPSGSPGGSPGGSPPSGSPSGSPGGSPGGSPPSGSPWRCTQKWTPPCCICSAYTNYVTEWGGTRFPCKSVHIYLYKRDGYRTEIKYAKYRRTCQPPPNISACRDSSNQSVCCGIHYSQKVEERRISCPSLDRQICQQFEAAKNYNGIHPSAIPTWRGRCGLSF